MYFYYIHKLKFNALLYFKACGLILNLYIYIQIPTIF